MRVAWTVVALVLWCPLGRDANVWQAKRAQICKPRRPMHGSPPLQTANIHSFAARRITSRARRTCHSLACLRCPLCCAVLCWAVRWMQCRGGALAAASSSSLVVEMFPSLRQTGGGEKTTLASLDPKVNIAILYINTTYKPASLSCISLCTSTHLSYDFILFIFLPPCAPPDTSHPQKADKHTIPPGCSI